VVNWMVVLFWGLLLVDVVIFLAIGAVIRLESSDLSPVLVVDEFVEVFDDFEDGLELDLGVEDLDAAFHVSLSGVGVHDGLVFVEALFFVLDVAFVYGEDFFTFGGLEGIEDDAVNVRLEDAEIEAL
jgi:hypothetical protein